VSVAYVDSSCIVAIALGERAAAAALRRLERFDDLVTSNLLEAEVLSVLDREDVVPDPAIFGAIQWIIPDRPLGAEISRVLKAGYTRGAHCWHLAAALYLAEDPKSLSFLTLDARQAKVADALGFRRL
jgi:predicted nucleic acid-binding protein